MKWESNSSWTVVIYQYYKYHICLSIRFTKLLQENNYKFSKQQVDNFWLQNPYLSQKSQAPRRRYKKKFNYRNYMSPSQSLSVLQADVWTIPDKWKGKDGLRYFLCVIDTVSRFAYLRPMKTKSAHEVADKLQNIIIEIRRMQSDLIKNHEILVFTDFGSEFLSSYTKQKMKENNTYLYVVGGESKAGLCEEYFLSLS